MIRIRGVQDFWAGVMFLAIGVLMFVGASNLVQGTAARMGPGYAPRLLCGLLVATGCALVAKGLFASGGGTGTWNVRPMLFVLGSILVFAFALERLGLVISIILAVGVSSLSIKPARPLETAIVAVTMAAGCTLMFIYGLKLIIPVWPQL
jgi:putative tricarboxylic transport membrane protein